MKQGRSEGENPNHGQVETDIRVQGLCICLAGIVNPSLLCPKPCTLNPGMQAYESPLLVVVAAGAVALPTLVKLAGVMSSHSQVGCSRLEACSFFFTISRINQSLYQACTPQACFLQQRHSLFLQGTELPCRTTTCQRCVPRP